MKSKKKQILKNQYVSLAGIPCLWPVFYHYTGKEEHVGRHNGTVWPHIEGFWGAAAHRQGKKELFEKELEMLATFAIRDGQFGEVACSSSS